MKTREGFVSNSSTTSFCIVGERILPKNVEADDVMICDGYESDMVVKVTPENIDIIRRMHRLSGPLWMKVFYFDRDGGSVRKIVVDGEFDIVYGANLDYDDAMTTAEIKERYEE